MKPHPWFNPPYRRYLVFAICCLWVLIEAVTNASSVWFLVAIGITAYAAYDFFLAGHYPVADDT